MRLTASAFLILAAVSCVTSAGIIDLLWNDEKPDLEERNEDANPATCECNGLVCNCCIDFNLTYIDLGGPGCVRMKYLSRSEGVLLNVSYGESVLQSKQVKGPDAEPACAALLTNFAHVCARFSEMTEHGTDGLRGCLEFEPKLLGDVTASFHIGCFTMDAAGMKLDKINATATTVAVTGQNTTVQNVSSGLNEDELIAVVNESAQQSLVFFQNLFDFAFREKSEPDNNNNKTNVDATQSNTNTSNVP